MDSKPLELNRSYSMMDRARNLIPGGAQTFSKGPTQIVQNVSPLYLERGLGSHVWDVDGNEFIDYPTSLGPIVLGHNDPDVTKAVIAQISKGTIFSLSHPIELEMAETLVDAIPCADMVRYGKNGSDVTSAAVRVSRAFTGRDIVALSGYHGWQDWYIGTTTRNAGVPSAVSELSKRFTYDDIDSLVKLFAEFPDQIACVIMEPVGVVEPSEGYLKQVKDICHKNGALLIFDEVLTGFRIAYGGAQERYGVVPDLACYAKALANGYPLSVVGGRRDVMELFDDIFFSFTFGGDALSLAAGQATLAKMQNEPVFEHLWRQGQKLQDGYNDLAREHGIGELTRCIGLAPRTVATFSDQKSGQPSLELRSLMQQELVRRGVLFLFGFNISYALSDTDVDHTLEALRSTMGVMASAIDSGDVASWVDGKIVQPVFRQA
jgi:glutamate-1-semialdehyde-2,1-aminomutase